MGSTDVLSQAGRETPGQTTETLPAAGCLMLATERNQAKGGGAHHELPHHHTHIFIFNCFAKPFYFASDRNISEMFIPDLVGADMQICTLSEVESHAEMNQFEFI